MEYRDFGKVRQQCPKCYWTGLGEDTDLQEWFRDGGDYFCPECGYRFGYVAWPLNLNKPNEPVEPNEPDKPEGKWRNFSRNLNE